VTDDVWRRRDRSEGDEGEFGPPLFGDDPTGEMPAPGGLSFGSSDTGPLPHWTEPPTGEMPRTLATPPPADTTGEVDVWSSFSTEPPVWSDDPPATGDLSVPIVPVTALGDETTDDSAPIPRREPGRITIGTDPTEDRLGRPVPKGRSRSSTDLSRGVNRGGRPPVPSRSGPAASAGRDMPTAVAVGLLIAAAFIASLLIKPVAALVVIVVIIGLASVEFFDKVTEKGYRPATVAGIVACTGAPVAAYFYGDATIPLVMVLALAAGCATFISSSGIESNPMPNMAITMLGVTWIGMTGAFGAAILRFSNFRGASIIGTDTLFLLALGVVANDTGALFIGSAAGRTPLRQWISPNKTLEGFIGGTIMTLLALIVVGVTDRSDTWNSTGDLIILGIVISITAPLGDLTESMFKRNLDVKDFGSIVKGHGGVLDRFDGFLFTLPAVYYLMLILQPWATK